MIKLTSVGRDVEVEITDQKSFSIEKSKVDYVIHDATHVTLTVGGGGLLALSEIELGGSIPADLDEFRTLWSTVFHNPGGAGSSTLTVGNPVSATTKGATISGGELALHLANTSGPGMVSTGAQGFAGDKTFNGLLIAGSQLRVQDDIRVRSQNASGFYSFISAPALSADRSLTVPDEGGTLATREYTENQIVDLLGQVFVIEIDYANIVQAIDEEDLFPGSMYKITDRGDRGLFFKAISTSELSKEGIRKMLCPAFYGVGADGGNDWIGVWNATKNVDAGNLTIWGGLVWENLTGVIGTQETSTQLDAVNWAVVPKASFSNGEYIEMQFGVIYDVANDWIERQWDGKNNEVGVSYIIGGGGSNPCNGTDWNMETSGTIFFGNHCISGVTNNSNGGIILNNRVQTIFANTNSGAIRDNVNVGQISDNSNSGDITHNANIGDIDANSNGGDISYNINSGSVNLNTNVGGIHHNRNNGNIASCDSGVNPCDIHHNINNGSISGTFADHVLDTVVDKT